MEKRTAPSGYEINSPEQYERISIIIEEIGEVLQVLGKIQKHGFKASFEGIDYDNKADLEIELGHVLFAISLMIAEGDIDFENISVSQEMKSKNIWKYLNFNREPDNWERIIEERSQKIANNK